MKITQSVIGLTISVGLFISPGRVYIFMLRVISYRCVLYAIPEYMFRVLEYNILYCLLYISVCTSTDCVILNMSVFIAILFFSDVYDRIISRSGRVIRDPLNN